MTRNMAALDSLGIIFSFMSRGGKVIVMNRIFVENPFLALCT